MKTKRQSERRSQRHRLRRILEMIRAGTRTGELPNARDFAAELEVCRRTICYDLDCLRDDEGAPIAYDPTRHGFHMADLTWQFPDLQMSDAEAFSLLVATHALAAFQGVLGECETKTVLTRLRAVLEGKLSAETYDLVDRISVYFSDYVPLNPTSWRTAAEAMANGDSVTATYSPVGTAAMDVHLDPYHLAAYRGNWYLLAGVRGAGTILTFAVSRFAGVRPTHGYVPPPADFDPEACFFLGLGFADGDDGDLVRLLVAPPVAEYVAERLWHPSQSVTPCSDGSVELAFRSKGGIEVRKLILSLQPHVRVLEPTRLRREVAAALRQGLAVQRSS